MTQNTHLIRSRSFFEYLSPFGVISTKEFIYRLFGFIGLFILFGFTSISSMTIIPDYVEATGNEGVKTPLIVFFVLSAVMLFWFILSTVTKEYRTYGMPIPFIFAAATPFLPFLFLIKYLLSSKVEREINQARAIEQKLFRENEKKEARLNKLPPTD